MSFLYKNNNPITVIVVDDSPMMCAMISSALEEGGEIKVLDTAKHAYDARDKIKKLNPDVITLDIQMPHMDGIDFLDKIMKLRPMPVVMLSSLTEKGTMSTIQALEHGALDYHAKFDSSITPDRWAYELREKVKSASNAKVLFLEKRNCNERNKKLSSEKLKKESISVDTSRRDKIIAIGSSTGGVEAINKIIPYFPKDAPPTLIVQHMPPKFTESFANRLNSISNVNVVEAKNNSTIEKGFVYISPGAYHMSIYMDQKTKEKKIKISNNEGNVNGHMPSVDVLFESFCKVCPEKTIAAILTGMGNDGAIGIKKLFDKGAFTIAQNKDSCVVYGMPGSAVKNGGIKKEVHINQIAINLLQNVK